MSVVYSQDWAEGNSVFTSMDVYDRDTNGPDAEYPEIENAEGVTVIDGRLDKSGTYVGDYQDIGVRMEGFPTFNAGLGATGLVTCRYRPNSASLASSPYHPLMVLRGTSGLSPNIEIYYDGFGPNLDIYAYDWGFGGDWNAQPAFSPVAGNEYVFKTCWQCQSAEGVADGFVRVYIDDALVAEVTNFAFFFDGNIVKRVDFGYFGLFGQLDRIRFNDAGCSTSPDPVEVFDNAPLCCGDGPSDVVVAGGGMGAGAEINQTPQIGTQLSCAGGGTVPTQTSLVHSEAWWGN